jgi:hypothetical protein
VELVPLERRRADTAAHPRAADADLPAGYLRQSKIG